MKEFLRQIDGSWTLFLDRDGVINRRIPGNYVKSWEEFEFMEGVPDAIGRLSARFGRIVVVTNQQGIGKSLMRDMQLQAIHQQMRLDIEKAGGRIDGIYSCPHLAGGNPFCRKPNPGMAYEAKADFPDIRFERSLMVGDSVSDILFGQGLGMKTVLVESKEGEKEKLEEMGIEVDGICKGLWDLADLV